MHGLTSGKAVNRNKIVCNYFISLYDNQSDTEHCRNGTANYPKAFIAYISNTIATTVNEFKTWLSTHNVTVEYELEEEVIVPYTSAQQEVYNQIKQALSYEEQTNISSNTIALFNVEAYQSTKLVLEEMATAIVALGGV